MIDKIMTHSLPLHRQQQLQYENGAMVIPGDRLGRISVVDVPAASQPITRTVATDSNIAQHPHIQYIAGEGTYIRNGCLFASIVGQVNVSPITIPPSETKESTTMSDACNTPTQLNQLHAIVSISPKDGFFRAMQQVIREGQIVLGRVVRVGTIQQQVFVDIVANPYGILDSTAFGTIRRDDVTKLISTTIATKQPVSNDATLSHPQPSLALLQLTQSFRPGDWIVAKVLSLGDDHQRYYLSTAESTLGVIYATCSISGQMMVPISHQEMECPITGIIETRKCARPPIKLISSATIPSPITNFISEITRISVSPY
jgi:exosome complex RNA-binding protein Csl4